MQNTGEFDGVRAYRRGDPLKLVVWKKAAKADELVSRDTQQAQRHELWLDFAQAGPPDPERKLSRLAAWVLQADQLGLDYGLRLPGQEIKPAQRRGAQAALPGGAGAVLSPPQRACPRDSRDTLFLLLVIGWVVLPQVGNLPLWCSALAAGVLVWRGWLAVQRAAAAGQLVAAARCWP